MAWLRLLLVVLPLVGVCLAAALLLVGARRLGRDLGRPRLWLVAVGVGLLLIPLALGPVVGVHQRTATLAMAEPVAPDGDGSSTGRFGARDDTARLEDLPPDTRDVVRRVIEGEPATADRYDVSVFGHALGSATVTHDGVRARPPRWPETFLFVGDGTDLDYVKVDGQWYWLGGSAGWRNPMAGWRSILWALSLPPAVLLGYLGTRPAED